MILAARRNVKIASADPIPRAGWRIQARLGYERRQYAPLARFSKPTIAQVQGYCIMGGLILATACDLIVAADDAKFCDRMRWHGAHVQYASLPWEIGFRKAKEYLFTGDWIAAADALRLGLVNRVVPRAQLAEETMALAARIACRILCTAPGQVLSQSDAG